MERKPLQAFLADLWNWLLAMAITVGAMGCMRTGLLLEPYDWPALVLTWGLTALLCCLCARLRRGPLILLGTILISAVLLYREGTLAVHLETLIYRISVIYDMAYGWGPVTFGGTAPLPGASFDMAMGLVGCLCVATCTACLCANTGTTLCVLVGFLPLAACMVVNDTPPDEGYLFLLLAALLVVMVTATVRRRSREDGLRLVALLLAPAILAVSLTFQIAPSNAFRSGFEVLQETLLSWFEKLPFSGVDGNGITVTGNGSYIDVTDLSTLGPQIRRSYPVMEITADYTGTVYLRGQAYDDYDGKNWAASYAASYANLEWPSAESRHEIGSITIKTEKALPLRYFPYYPAGLWWFSEFGRGYMANVDELAEYTFRVTELDENFYADTAAASSSVIVAPTPTDHVNLRLPDSTRAAALAYLSRYDLSAAANDREKARMICQLVSESAQYSLNTPKMPADEDDFAMWFLEDSDTGYCVHYATAAVVLLRASGIHAKYVTGYARDVFAGQTLTVNAYHAHAWVEYYDDIARCWRPLDPTPAAPDSTNPGTGIDTPAPQPTDGPTEPPVTEPPVTVPPFTEPYVGPTETLAGEDPQPTTATGDVTPPPDTPGQTQPQKFPWPALFGGLAAALLTAGQYFLRLVLRKKRLAAGTPNARALARWQQVLRYRKALKCKPPSELLELAEKARFSRHTLTDEELAQFDSYLAKAKLELKKQKLPKRIFWQLLLAIE